MKHTAAIKRSVVDLDFETILKSKTSFVEAVLDQVLALLEGLAENEDDSDEQV